jgi:hypothetical protein
LFRKRKRIFFGSGSMPKKGGTQVQVSRGSGVMGHAPRKALGVKKAVRKDAGHAGVGKPKPQKAAKAAVATKKGAGKPKKAAEAVEVEVAGVSSTPPRSPTYEPTEAWVANVAARIDTACAASAPAGVAGSVEGNGDGAGAGPEKTAPEGRRQSGERG